MKTFSITLFLLCSCMVITTFAQTTYTTYDIAGRWSTDGGATPCHCFPNTDAVAGDHIVVNHNACSGDLKDGTGCFNLTKGSSPLIRDFASITINSGGALYTGTTTALIMGGGNNLNDVTINTGGQWFIDQGVDALDDVNLTINGSLITKSGANLYTDNLVLNGTWGICNHSNAYGFTGTGTGTFDCNACTPDIPTVSWNASTFPTASDVSTINGTNVSGSNLCNVTLPVEMAFFKGEIAQTNASLSWVTLSEKNNNYFVVESSTNGIDFDSIATVIGNGNSSTLHSYSYSASFPSRAINYYRLKQVDYNGEYVYSKIIVLHAQQFNFNVSPNPAIDVLRLHLQANSNEPVQVSITNSTGQTVYYQTIEPTSINTISTADFTEGFYLIRVIQGEFIKTKKLKIIH